MLEFLHNFRKRNLIKTGFFKNIIECPPLAFMKRFKLFLKKLRKYEKFFIFLDVLKKIPERPPLRTLNRLMLLNTHWLLVQKRQFCSIFCFFSRKKLWKMKNFENVAKCPPLGTWNLLSLQKRQVFKISTYFQEKKMLTTGII